MHQVVQIDTIGFPYYVCMAFHTSFILPGVSRAQSKHRVKTKREYESDDPL